MGGLSANTRRSSIGVATLFYPLGHQAFCLVLVRRVFQTGDDDEEEDGVELTIYYCHGEHGRSLRGGRCQCGRGCCYGRIVSSAGSRWRLSCGVEFGIWLTSLPGLNPEYDEETSGGDGIPRISLLWWEDFRCLMNGEAGNNEDKTMNHDSEGGG